MVVIGSLLFWLSPRPKELNSLQLTHVYSIKILSLAHTQAEVHKLFQFAMFFLLIFDPKWNI